MKTKSGKSSASRSLSQKPGRIAPKSAIITMAILSILLGLWTGYQVSIGYGLVSGILYGLGFAAAIWVVYIIAYFFTRWLHRR